jgi:DNA-binding LacI/PurR family transcriptional regulator
MARVTIDDLAARLGISRASVSYALNGRPGVGEETRTRVLDLALELGWQPSVSARSLSRSRADAFGIVLRRPPEELGTEPYYMALLSGMESAFSDAGSSLMIRFVPLDDESEADVYRRWTAERRVDGVILTDLRHNDARPGLLADLPLPYLVHAGRRDDGESPDDWVFDQASDAELLVDHVAALDHRRIAHVTGPSDLVHESERNIAVLAGCHRHDIEVITVECDYSLSGGRNRTAELIAGDLRPTAIIYSNDLMAVGGSAALRDAGRDDIAVLSWDDSLLCQTAYPGITALQRNPYLAGRRTARELLRQVHADGCEPIMIIDHSDQPAGTVDGRSPDDAQPSRLIVRASSRRA